MRRRSRRRRAPRGLRCGPDLRCRPRRSGARLMNAACATLRRSANGRSTSNSASSLSDAIQSVVPRRALPSLSFTSVDDPWNGVVQNSG